MFECSGPVDDWLENLRFSTETYDANGPAAEDCARDGSSSPDFLSAEECSESGESEGSKRMSGSYENIWNCSSEYGEKRAVKYGQVCRISFHLDETVEELPLTPVLLAHFDLSVPTSILQWQADLLCHCSSEEEDFQVKYRLKFDFLDCRFLIG